MGALRPDKTAPRRFIFDYAHRTLGILTLLASSMTQHKVLIVKLKANSYFSFKSQHYFLVYQLKKLV